MKQPELNEELLQRIGNASVAFNDNFSIHPRLFKYHIETRKKEISNGNVDWATAEALAFGSLLLESTHVHTLQ